MNTYDTFLNKKLNRPESVGFAAKNINPNLFDWQKKIIEWATFKGRCALFEDCGLGKTLQQLEWANQVANHTGGKVLILAPLAVTEQTVEEGAKFGIKVTPCREPEQMPELGIGITNYDRLEKFEDVARTVAGVVLDESSILKGMMGKTRIALTKAFSDTPYRLACTATPSPNDLMELSNHAEFLGIMSAAQMLATWFINDAANTGEWRLKKHAKNDFWEWVSSWAACISNPKDLGFEMKGFNLPPLNIETIKVEAGSKPADEGELFSIPGAMSAIDVRKEKRRTLQQRCDEANRIARSINEPVLIWCDLNDEADLLVEILPKDETVEVRGSDTAESKEKKLLQFTHGEKRIMVTKPSIAGYGLNWQHCHNVIFVGITYSFEDFYQAVRRNYRFGQKNEVHVRCITTESDETVFKALKRKMDQHDNMHKEMQKYGAGFLQNKKSTIMKTTIDKQEEQDWTLYHGDCVRAASMIESDSVGFSVFSPPFADLFTYSNDQQDMGNCSGTDEFMEHFGFLIDELKRVMMPGREVCVHCCDLLSTKWKDGSIQFKDFSGEIIRAFWKRGFSFHSRITIWKSPVVEMQRTKAHGLLYKTLCKDSANSRVGAPDYLLTFRKPGVNPKPIEHTPEDIPLDLWQEIASPVWMTIDQGNVLNGHCAREQGDERHICPLQLDVINRALLLWSAKDDLVYSPFTGIGSEGYCALKMGRKFVGSELKNSYFDTACENLKMAKSQTVFEF